MQTKTGQMAKNSLFVLIGRVSELVIRIATIILIARYLGVEDFGSYAFVRGIAIVVTVLIAWANLMVIIREISTQKETAPQILSSALFLHLVMGTIVICLATVILVFFIDTDPEIARCIILVLTAQTLFVMQRSASSIFIAFEKAVFDSIITICNRVFALVLTIGVVLLDLHLVGIFSASIIASLAGLLFSLFLISTRLFTLKFDIHLSTIQILFKESFSLCISDLIINGYTNLNVFFLKAFQTPIEISFFNTPQRLIEPLQLIPRSIMIAIMPVISSLAITEDKRSELISLYGSVLKNMIILCIPIVIFFLLYSLQIIIFIFGDDFRGAEVPMQIWSFTLIPLFINILNTHILTALKKQKVFIFSNSVCFLIVLTFGYFLIQQFAAIGASITVSIGNVTLFIINYYFTIKYLGSINILSIIIRPIIATIAMVFICILAKNMPQLPIFICSVLVYFIILLNLKTFTDQEIHFFKKITHAVYSKLRKNN